MMNREDVSRADGLGDSGAPHTLLLLFRDEPASLRVVRAQLPPCLPLAQGL